VPRNSLTIRAPVLFWATNLLQIMKRLFIVELSLMWQTFNFVVSFEVFLNSNCSIDLAIFWKGFDHFSCYFCLCFCYSTTIGLIWCDLRAITLVLLNMNSFIYVNWSLGDLRSNFELYGYGCISIFCDWDGAQLLDSLYQQESLTFLACYHVYSGYYLRGYWPQCLLLREQI